MASTLSFSNYIGGADSMQIEQIFPSNQKTYIYDFGQNITDWIFFLDFQTVVVDILAFDRNTGEPNFANSSIIGTFPSEVIDVETYVQVIDAPLGRVAITIPASLYTGPVIPDARSHTPITIVGVTWTVPSTPAQITTHRWAFIQAWEPGVVAGDPILEDDFVPVVIGA
jgi:hypothetical protein